MKTPRNDKFVFYERHDTHITRNLGTPRLEESCSKSLGTAYKLTAIKFLGKLNLQKLWISTRRRARRRRVRSLVSYLEFLVPTNAV